MQKVDEREKERKSKQGTKTKTKTKTVEECDSEDEFTKEECRGETMCGENISDT